MNIKIFSVFVALALVVLYCVIIKACYSISRDYYVNYMRFHNAANYHYKEGLNEAVMGNFLKARERNAEMKRTKDTAEKLLKRAKTIRKIAASLDFLNLFNPVPKVQH